MVVRAERPRRAFLIIAGAILRWDRPISRNVTTETAIPSGIRFRNIRSQEIILSSERNFNDDSLLRRAANCRSRLRFLIVSRLICPTKEKEERRFGERALPYFATCIVTRNAESVPIWDSPGTPPAIQRSIDPDGLRPLSLFFRLTPACSLGAFPFGLWSSQPSGRDRQGLLREHTSSRNFSVKRALELEGSPDSSTSTDTRQGGCERERTGRSS